MPFDYNQFAAKKPQENANGVQPVDYSSNLDNVFAEAEAELQKTNNTDTQVPKIDAPTTNDVSFGDWAKGSLKGFAGTVVDIATNAASGGAIIPTIKANREVDKMKGSEDFTPEVRKALVESFADYFSATNITDPIATKTRRKGKEIADNLNQGSKVYGDKDFTDFYKSGEYGKMVGDIMREGVKSIPYTIGAAFSAPATFGIGGLSGAMDRYDEISDRTDLNQIQKVSNALAYGAIQSGSELLFDIPMVKWLKGLYSKAGKEAAEQAVKEGYQSWMNGMFKKYGLLLAPVGEGTEEVAGAFGNAVTDIITGVDPDAMQKFPENAMMGFVYGAGGGLQGSMAALPGVIANKVNNYKEKKQARANIEANLSPITNAKTGNVHAVKLRGQEKDEDEVYFVVDVDDDGFANIVDRQGNKVLDSEGKPYQNIEDFTTENVISREQILQGELQSLTQEQAAKEQAEAQTEREKNELAQIPEQLTIPNENGKEQKYVFAGEVRRNNPEKPNEITDFEVGLVDEFGEMPYDIAFLPAKTVYDYIKSQNESNEKELDQVLADAEKEVSAENSDQNGQNVTTAPSEDSNLSGKPVVTQKIGNADIDVIENEDHDEIVPSEKMPLEKALPLLEKKFKDNPKYEVVAEKERVEIPGRVIKGETKWDEDIVEPSTFKTVIKSVKIFPKEVLNQRRKEEQESKSFYQEQKKSILIDALTEFNATPESRSDKQKASEIEALATKLGYMTDRSPMNEIRIFNNKEGYVNIPKTAQPEKSGQINQLQTNENISNPDKLTTFKPEQQVNTPETTQPKATKPPTPKQIERAKLLKSEPNSAREVILKYFLSGGKVSPEMINRESIGRDRTGKLRSEGERRSMFWVTKQGEANYTDQLEHILHGTPWENMLDDPTDFSNEVLDVLSLGTPSNMMAELKRLQSEQGSFDQQYSPEQVSEIEALAAQQAERERLDYEEQLQTVFEELFENQNISEQEIVNLFYTNNEENGNDQNEGRSGQASPENSTTTGDNPTGSIEADRGNDTGEESQTERFGLKPTQTIQDLSENINSILEQYSGREMAAIQAEKYLNEFPELGQQYLNGNNITSRDELKSHLAKLQSKVREGKGKERQENKKQFKEQKTQQAIDEIEQMALAADAEMQKQIEESEYNETFENKEPEKSTETKQEESVNKEDNNILEIESSPKNNTSVNQNIDFFTEIQKNIPTNDKIKLLEDKLARQKKLREQKVKNMNERNGLFGDAQADPRQIDLFAETFAPTQENFQKAIDKVDAEINSIQKEIDQERRVLLTAARENKGQLEIISKEESKVDTNPTEAQKEAGNYKMGHVNIQGLDITIENPKGSVRSGVDKTGKPWSVTMNNTYGYFKRTVGKDGDHVDVFLGDKPLSDKVFVIDQNNEDGNFDESKVMLGFDSAEQAQSDYMKNYSPGWKGFGAITESSIDDFKEWLNDGARQNKAYSEYVENKSESTIPDNPKNKFVNTEKLIQHILKNSSLKIGEEYTNEDGEKYRYDKYTSNYTNTPYWLSVLFYDAAKENGPEYSNQFSYNDYLFYFDRAKYKGQMDKKISISKLILLDKEQNQSVEPNEKVEEVANKNKEAINRLNSILSQYGWTTKQDGNKIALINRNNKVVAYISGTDNKYSITDIDGKKLLNGNNGIENGAEKVAIEYFYAKKDENKPSSNTIFTEDAKNAALERIRKRRGNLNAGINPEDMLDMITIAGYHIEAGARKFVDFANNMIGDLGEWVKPYLKGAYENIRRYPGMETIAKEMDSTQVVDEYDFNEEIINKDTSNEQITKSTDSIETEIEVIERERKSLELEAENVTDNQQAGKIVEKIQEIVDSIDQALTQIQLNLEPYSVGDIDHEQPNIEVAKKIKKDVNRFSKALANVLGMEHDTDRKGKPNYGDANIAPAGGDATFILWAPNSEYGIYVSIPYHPDYKSGYDDYKIQGISWNDTNPILFRVTTKKDKYRGLGNQYTRANITVGEFSKIINRELKSYVGEDLISKSNQNNSELNKESLTLPKEIKTNGKQRVLQGNNKRAPKPASPSLFDRVEGEQRTGGSIKLQSGEILGTNGEQQQPTGREGNLLPRNADLLEPALVEFNADENDTKSFNPTQKYNDNIAAIETVISLIREKRAATPQEKETLSKYVGFGGLKDVVLNPEIAEGWKPSNIKYKPQVKRIIELANEFNAVSGAKDSLGSITGSILNAHFTPSTVIHSVYDGLKKLGFKGGQILEPSAGIGNFVTFMPNHVKNNSTITAVELDDLTGNILKYLHDDVNVKVSGIQDANIPNNSQDLVISNVPFGNYKIFDKAFKGVKEQFQNRIHNYFFAKAVDMAREGGLIAFVTSKGVMDAPGNEQLRRYLDENTDFLGAVRLPNNAFKNNANTEVVTDIIFLKKNTTGTTNNIDFVSVKEVEATHKDGEKQNVTVNNYFIKNPQNMLGDIVAGGLYSRDDYTVENKKEYDLSAAITKALPKDVYTPTTSGIGLQANDSQETIDAIKEGNIHLTNGRLVRKQEGQLVDISINEPTAKIEHYITLRDSLMNLIYSEYLGKSDKEVNELRYYLNRQYDTFVKKYGKLDKSAIKIAKQDADGYNVLSLEVKGKQDGKADIFRQRTIQPIQNKLTAENIDEAIVISLYEHAKIDIERIAELMNLTIPEAIEKAKGKIFEEPTGGFVTRDEYLSGNVKQKLKQAQQAVENGNTEFQNNVDELQYVIPRDIPAMNIEARLGSRWIPQQVYTDFAQYLFNTPQARIIYQKSIDAYSHDGRVGTVEATNKYGTSRRNGLDILVDALLINPPKIYDTIREFGQEKRVLNTEETAKAIEKYEEIRNKFEDWVYKSEDRRTLLSGIYNERFNTSVKRSYNGDHLNISGINGVELRKHQKDAIWMLLQNNGGIIDHLVGAGKTYVMVAGTMEMKRTGVAKKPMIMALKSTIPQIVESYRNAFPMAKILAPLEKDFTKENRNKLFAQIANNEWDVIIMSHENYGKIPHESDIQQKFIEDEMAEIEEERAELSAAGEKQALKGLEIRLKNLEARLEKISNIDKDNSLTFEQMGIDHIMVDESQQFKNLSYVTKQRGVAGLSKAEGSKRAFNLFIGIRYLQQKYGEDKGTTFLSGTPISNSMVEMYLLLKYLRPGKMNELGFNSFDAWATTFASPSSDIEFTVTGDFKAKTRFREFINVPELSMLYTEIADIRTDENTPLDKPKMKGGGYTVEEIKMSEDQIEYGKKLMEFARTKNGSHIGMTLSKNQETAAMLLATNLSSKMAIDMRLIDSGFSYDPNGKIAKLADNVARIYNETDKYKGTQLIFSDLGTPKNKTNKAALLRDYMEDEMGVNLDTLNEIFGDTNEQTHRYPSVTAIKNRLSEVLEMTESEIETIIEEANHSEGSFNVYAEVKQRLIEKGIPAEQVVFIHDYNSQRAKEGLFKEVQQGNIRIVLGSTQKLGTGVNVQDRVVAVHHLDVPWTPASMEQRNGRALRQGNKITKEHLNNELPVYAYATERTLDAYKYQLLQTKQRFLDQVKSGEVEDRVIRESDGDSESGVGYAELVAMLSGNTDILTKSKLETKVNDLKRKKRNFLSEVYEAKSKIDEIETRNPQIEKRIELTTQNIKELTNAMQYDENGKMVVNDIDGKKLTTVKDEKGKTKPAERTDYAKEAIKIVEDKLNKAKTGDEVDLFTINGIKISGRSNEASLIGTQNSSLFINASNGEKYSVTFSLIPGAFLNNIQKTIENIPNIQRAQEAIVEKNKRDLKAYRELIEKGTEWEKEAELTQAIEELKEVTKRLTPVEEAKPEQTSEEKQKSDNTIRIGDLSFNLGKEGFSSIAEAYNSKTGNTEAVVRINEQLRNEDYAKEVKPLIDLFNGEWNKSNKVILFGNLKDAANFKDTIDRVFGKVDQSIEEEYSPETEIKKETPIAPQVQKEPAVAKLLPVEEFKHTKTGQILYNVKINGRSDEYSNMVSVAKRYNPYGKQKPYNTFSKGFLFEKKEDAENFKNEVNNTAFNQNIANEPYSPYQNNGDVVNDSSETYEIYRYFDSKFVDYDLVLLKQGDFYEALGNSALNTSSVLGTVLTKRNDGKRTYNVTGFPSHNLETYLPKLRRSGLSVIAIDENGNIQTPSTNKTSNGTFNQAEEVQRTTEPNNGNGPSTDNVQRQGNTIPKNSNGEYKGIKGQVYQELKNLILTHKVKIFDSATFNTLFNKLNTKKVTHLTSSPYNTFGNPFNIAYTIYNQLEDYNGENFNDPKELGFNEEDSTPLLRKVSPIGFYSTVESALEQIKQEKGTTEQFKAMLLKNGAKQAEIDWMGFDDRFPDTKQSITKADIQNWIDQNKIEVQEVVKGDLKPSIDPNIKEWEDWAKNKYPDAKNIEVKQKVFSATQFGYDVFVDGKMVINGGAQSINYMLPPLSDTKFSLYVEPGGSNYKEVLLTMPEKQPVPTPEELETQSQSDYKKPYSELSEIQKSEIKKQVMANKGYTKDYSPKTFKSSHFEEPNILAHIRFNEREVNGERVLFLEEIQSDFSQAVRKGTTTAKTPFEKTDQWVNLAFRRMMRYAAENGFDRIAWTNGEQQAARYDLSKSVDYIQHEDGFNGIKYVDISTPSGLITFQVDKSGKILENKNQQVPESIGKNLSDVIGKDITEKILTSTKSGRIEGEGLKIGGEGMKAFYDAIVPSAASKLGKPFEARVENIQIDVKPEMTDEGIDLESGEVGTAPEGKYAEVQSIPITDKMIESVSQGVPLFRNEYDTPLEAAERVVKAMNQRAEMVRGVADRLSNELNTPIIVVRNETMLPLNLQRQVKKQGAKRSVMGVFNPADGKIYLVSNNIPSELETEKTILHEIVGHKGLRGLLGAKEHRNLMQHVWDSLTPAQKADLKNRLGNLDPLILAYEHMAELAEQNSTPKWYEKVLAKLREMLRKVFPNLRLNNAELKTIIRKSYEALKRPAPEQFDNPLDFAEALGRHVKNTNEPASLFRRAPQQKEENSDLDKAAANIERKPSKVEVGKIWEETRKAIQDRDLPVRRLIENIVKRGGRLNNDANAYRDISLAHGRAENLLKNFEKDLMQQVIDAVSAFKQNKGVTQEKITLYTIAKHAPERNAQIRKQRFEEWLKQNPQPEDPTKYTEWETEVNEYQEYLNTQDFSGILSQDVDEEFKGNPEGYANQLVKDFEAIVERKQVNDYWKAVRGVNKFTLGRWLEGNQIDPDYYEQMVNGYKYYVPLKGWWDDAAKELDYHSGKGTGKSLHKAEGRKSLPDDPLAYMEHQAFKSISEQVDNEVKLSMLRFVMDNMKGNEDIINMKRVYYVQNPLTGEWDYTLEKPTPEQFADGSATMVQYRDHFKLRKPVNAQEHEVWVDTKYGTFAMVFPDKGLEVAQALNHQNNLVGGMDAEMFNKFLGGSLGKITNIQKALYTSWNVTFPVKNILRDMPEAASHLLVKYGPKQAADFSKELPLSMGTAKRYLYGKFSPKRDNKGNALNNDAHFEDFASIGGMTGFTHLKTPEEYQKELSDRVRKAAKKGVNLKEQLEKFSELFEDTTRFAAYKSGILNGMSKRDAAMLAKEVSVNFNRKGKLSKSFDAIFAFFNAALQAGQKNLKLAKDNPKAFMAVAAGWVVLGGLIAEMNRMFDDDDEEYERLNSFVRMNYLVFPISNGEYFRMPLPQFFRGFYGMGANISDLAHGKTDFFKAMGNGILNFTNALTPIELSAFFDADSPWYSSFVPTVFKPMSEIAENKDFMNYPIYKEAFTKDLEGKLANSGMHKNNVNTAYKFVTDALFRAGGGDSKYKSYFDKKTGTLKEVNPVLDWNPSKIEYFIKAYTGGTGAFINDFANTLMQVSTTGTVEQDNIPFINSFVRNYPEKTIKVIGEYYDMKKDVDKFKSIFNEYKKDPSKSETIDDMLNNKKYWEQASKVKKIDKQFDYLKNQFENGNMTIDEYIAKRANIIIESELKTK